MQLERHGAIREHAFVFDRFDHEWPGHFREAIGVERVSILENFLFVISPVRFVRDDRNTFGRICPNAARVIEMVMRVDEVLDGLVWKHPLRFRDRCHRSIVSSRAFDDDEIVFELDEKTLRRTIIQQPDAVANLLGLNLHTRRFTTTSAATSATDTTTTLRVAAKLRRCRAVRFDVPNGEFEYGEAALALNDVHRELHAAKILIVGVNAFN